MGVFSVGGHERGSDNAYSALFSDRGLLIPGADGMRGVVQNGLITVTGPCGKGHTMSAGAALALAQWLESHAKQATARDLDYVDITP